MDGNGRESLYGAEREVKLSMLKPVLSSITKNLGTEGLHLSFSLTIAHHPPLRFHSESRVLTTIFGLLFWDIIFSDVPGAFETPYQIAPLDLSEDSFYRARKHAIDRRLEEIKYVGKALEVLAEHDERWRERKTWCVGVRWDICERADLLEIIEVSSGVYEFLGQSEVYFFSALVESRCR